MALVATAFMTKDTHHNQAPGPAGNSRGRKPIHHSPVFWVGFVLILVAIAFYVLSDDLAWRPRNPAMQGFDAAETLAQASLSIMPSK
jgi:hypothetical protein